MFFNNPKKEKDNFSFSQKLFLLLSIIILAFISFTGGVYFGRGYFSVSSGRETINNEKKEQINEKYSSVEENEQEELAQEEDIDFGLYWELWEVLKKDYVDREDVSDQDMFYGSLKGMAASLDDPYTVFMDPDDSDGFADELLGTFQGIGCEVGLREGILTVVAPLDGSPAEKAGLIPGDKIMEIDDEPTLNMSIDEAVMKIRGEKGTKVVLTVYREESDETLEIEIIRDEIYIKSVHGELRSDGIYVLEINNFNEDTLGPFNQKAQEIIKMNPSGIILDLRSNPGGFLDTSVEVASEWREEGVIVSEMFSENQG